MRLKPLNGRAHIHLSCIALAVTTGLLIISAPACSRSRANSGQAEVSIGYLNNITHVQALVSIANGNSLGRDAGLGKIEMRAFNTGPAAVDAITSGDLDAAYVGPTGALNAYYRTHGEMFVAAAGSATGGARLMVRKESAIAVPSDFSGRTIATPGIGNTQDVALRSWLALNNLKPRELGGTVSVRPIANPDIFQLMMRGRVDAAWVPEPWATRLEIEAGAKTFLDERELWPRGEFSSVMLVVARDFIARDPAGAKRLVEAHGRLTTWIIENPDIAMQAANSGLERSLGQRLHPDVLRNAFDHFDVTLDPLTSTVAAMASEMSELGYLPSNADASSAGSLFDLNYVRLSGFRA